MKKNNIKKIEFIKTSDKVSDLYFPVPASKEIPEWYKNISSYMGGDKAVIGKGETLSTIKKCMPVFDSISSGYLLKTYCDIEILWDGISYEFVTSPYYGEVIVGHSAGQVTGHPGVNNRHTYVPKLLNLWAVKTSPGYSSLILPPMHRNNIINIFPGIIDSDSFHDVTNFPFTVNTKEEKIIIPAGTPIAQVIPFKREDWKMSINDDPKDSLKSSNSVRSVFFEAYKNMFWNKKSYK
jgi:hypothetical protein